MKSILCFGDSNTWGFDAETNARFSRYERWPGVLQKALGDKFYIIEEGLGARTTAYEDPFNPSRSGAACLPMLLESHAPLELVIIMLGTNDLQCHQNLTAREAARGLSLCINTVKKSLAGPNGLPPQLLIVCPPEFKLPQGYMDTVFGPNINESKQLAKQFSVTCNFYDVPFFDANTIIESGDKDGIHITKNSHQILGSELAFRVKKLLPKTNEIFLESI